MTSDVRAAATDQPVGGVGDVGELYEQLWAHVRRRVGRGVRAPEPVIDEACQVAWGRLVHHRGRVRRSTAFSWLVTTAEHEALKLLRSSQREVSLEALLDLGDEPEAGHVAAPDELVEARLRLESLARLPERQQRLVWLQAFGLSYAEMAAGTGASRRTVERQILRAKRELKRSESAATR